MGFSDEERFGSFKQSFARDNEMDENAFGREMKMCMSCGKTMKQGLFIEFFRREVKDTKSSHSQGSPLRFVKTTYSFIPEKMYFCYDCLVSRRVFEKLDNDRWLVCFIVGFLTFLAGVGTFIAAFFVAGWFSLLLALGILLLIIALLLVAVSLFCFWPSKEQRVAAETEASEFVKTVTPELEALAMRKSFLNNKHAPYQSSIVRESKPVYLTREQCKEITKSS